MTDLEFIETGPSIWRATCGEDAYIILKSAGFWYWYVTRKTNAVIVDSYESAVAACQKHFEEKSNVG